MGRAHDTKVFEKDVLPKLKRTLRSVGGIARVFFSLHILFINSSSFDFILCLDQWTQRDQTNKAKRCRGRKQLQKRRQTRSKSYGTWGQ